MPAIGSGKVLLNAREAHQRKRASLATLRYAFAGAAVALAGAAALARTAGRTAPDDIM
jgi:hypothetical protein